MTLGNDAQSKYARAMRLRVIRSTLVPQSLDKIGIASRSEITVDAMGERAECVQFKKARISLPPLSLSLHPQALETLTVSRRVLPSMFF
jgi:hypothetical protein